MPVQKQIVPVSFQGGLQQKQDPNQVQSPNMLGLENAQFNKIGQLNKRPGYNILTNNVSDGTTIETAYAIDSFNEELNLFDNKNIYSYSPSSETWINRGVAISLINSTNQIIRSPASQQLNPDCAAINNIQVFVWEDSTQSCRYSVVDSTTGTYIVSNAFLLSSTKAGARPKIVVYSNLFYIFYTNTNALFYQIINPLNPNVISAPIDIFSDGQLNFVYDVVVTDESASIVPYVIVASYVNSNGYLNTFYLTTDQTESFGNQSIAILIQGYSISNFVDSTGTLWISWSDGITVNTTALNGTGASLWQNTKFAKTVIDTVDCPLLVSIENATTPGSLQLIYEVAAADPLKPYNELIKVVICNIYGTPILKIGTLRSVGIASKPYFYNGNNFLNVAFQSELQSTYFGIFLTGTPFTIIDKVSSTNGGGLRTNGMASECPEISPGEFLWSNLTKGKFISEDNTNFALLGVQSTKCDFTNINKFNSVTFSNNLLFVGGILQSYDGVSINEQNFHIYPEGVAAFGQTSGSGHLTTTAQYQYQVLYSWTDNIGQIQYSSPSPTITITLSGSQNAVELNIPTLRLTAKQGVVIQVYRTIANGGASGNPVFYVTTSLLTPPNPITGLGGGGILNDPNADFVVFYDYASDLSIEGNQPIYTQGGILPNSAPPSCSMISLFQDRVILGGLEDPDSLWFSQTKNNNSSFNTIPVEFSADNVISISEVGGSITALGLMDQNLIIFKKNAIFILAGSGPNNTGGGNSFPDAQLITQQVGCINPNSILLFGQGIVFQSPDKGIWLLDRNLSPPSYLGAGVDDIALQYQVSSATLDPNSNSIIFTTNLDSNGVEIKSSLAMVYDYLIGQWSTYTNHNAVDSISFQNLFTFVKSNGLVYQQAADQFYDGYIGQYAQPYSMTLTTPWISTANILGYQRIFKIFLLGTYKGPHTLNVSIAYDFDRSFYQTIAIPTALTSGSNLWGTGSPWGINPTIWGGSSSPYIYQINPAIQKCSSFRLQISDSQSSNYNEGYALSSLLLEVGIEGNGIRLPKTNKFGIVI